MVQSLRARNPSARVANSIYDREDDANSAFTHGAATLVAPSEREFEFDNVVVNTQAYRRAMAHTQTEMAPPNMDSQRESTLQATSFNSQKPTLRAASNRSNGPSSVYTDTEPIGDIDNLRLLASGSYDNTVKIWDPEDRRCVSTLRNHVAWVSAVAWSPDSARLASGSDDSTVKIWDLASGRCESTLKGHKGSAESVAWSHLQ